MLIQRRQLGLQAGAFVLAAAAPPLAWADPGDTVTRNNAPEGRRELHATTQRHHTDKVTATFLKYDWHIDFGSKNIAQNDWKYDFPENGEASVRIDNHGNWQFSGSFPKGPLAQPCLVTVAIALTGHTGKVYAFSHNMTVFHDGASWSKSGHDQVVQNLWNDLVQGHDWQWAAHAKQVPQNAPPPPPDCNGGLGLGGLFANIGEPAACY